MIGGNLSKMVMLLSFLLICLASASTQFLVHDDNESAYSNLLNVTWSQYNEDLNCSSKILAEYVKKNITAREALVATMSIYTLASKTKDEFHKAKPANKYKIINNNTIAALSDFEQYLWNLTKFYETDKAIYAVKSPESFNNSQYYIKKRDAMV